MNNNSLILKLHDIEAVKFGQFTLKSGMVSPIYIDLRVIISYPEVLKEVSQKIFSIMETLDYDIICGAPYTALPIASAISVMYNKPMVMKRKEVKEYGTKKLIEGVITPGQKCLIIDDMITNGASKLETIKPLEDAGLVIKDVVVLVDRQQSGKPTLEEHGYKLHSAINLSEILDLLKKEQRISDELFQQSYELIKY